MAMSSKEGGGGGGGKGTKRFCGILWTQLSPFKLLMYVDSCTWDGNPLKASIYHSYLQRSQKCKRLVPRDNFRNDNPIVGMISFIFMIDFDEHLRCITSSLNIFILTIRE